jgi:hypothetical protein
MEQQELQEEQKIRGRDAFLNKMKEKNPDYAPADDDALLDDIHGDVSEKEEMLGKYTQANQKLADLVAKDPQLGAVLSMLVGENPVSLPYAVAKVYGKEVFEMEGEDLENFESGYKEKLASQAESDAEYEEQQKNIEQYKSDLEAYCNEQGYDEVRKQELHDSIVKMADDCLMGRISKEVIERQDKGINYDKDVQEAADTGYVEGKNERIDMKKKTVQSVPDLNNTTNAGTVRPAQPAKRGSFFDEIKV